MQYWGMTLKHPYLKRNPQNEGTSLFASVSIPFDNNVCILLSILPLSLLLNYTVYYFPIILHFLKL